MGIKQEDMLIMKAQRMTQEDDGGGKISGYQLVTGRADQVFDPITPVGRVTGDIQVAKLFPTIKTYGVEKIGVDGKPIIGKDGKPVLEPEKLLDANMIITNNADDKAVGALIFTTNSPTDTVRGAKDKISSHLNKTSRIPGELEGVQLKDSRQIKLVTQLKSDIPNSGDTICIVQDEGKPSEIEQYLKIDKVEFKHQEIVVKRADQYVPLLMKVVTIYLFLPLEYDFDGGEITGVDNIQKRAYLRSTQVTDSGRYKGCSDLLKDARIGDMSVVVDDVYGQLIPPMENQANIVDQQAGSDLSPLVDSGGKITKVENMNFGAGTFLTMPLPIKPSSLKITYSGAELVDREGQLMSGDIPIGQVDYHTGAITFGINAPTITGQKTITYQASAAPFRVSDSVSVLVTEGNRGYSFNETLFPPPAPGNLSVSYAILGKWYEMVDTGSGILRGIENNGTGKINYSTGSVEVTLPELPDIGSSLIWTFGVKTNYKNRGKDYADGTLDTSLMKPRFKVNIGKSQIVRTSLVLKWGKNRQAKDDGKGNITGDATGTILYASGDLDIMFKDLPAKNVLVYVSCDGLSDDAAKKQELFGYAGQGTVQRIQLNDQFIKPKSIQLNFNVVAAVTTHYRGDYQRMQRMESNIYVYDDGFGNLLRTDGSNAGTIDYNAGIINVNTHQDVFFWVPIYKYDQLFDWDWRNKRASPPTDGSQFMRIEYGINDQDDHYETELKLEHYTLNLTPSYQETIVPGSVMFNFGGREYVDRNGRLESDFNLSIGQGTFAGYINYQNGDINLDGWNEGGSSEIVIKSLLTSLDIQPISSLDFRVRASPIRSASLQISALRVDGVRLEGRADEGGRITSEAMEGIVNISNGVVSIKFGQLVNASGYEDEEWFDPSKVVDGKIWWPWFVYADTIKFNAVATKFAAVDPKILKINPQRLPNNGKVQIVRNGDLVVLHEQTSSLLPNNPPAGLEFNIGQTLLTEGWVEDAKGVILPAEFYEIDEITGKGKMLKAPTSDYQQPLKAIGNIEEENSVSDTQINGQIALTKPLRHNFSKNAKLSGVLHFGTLQSRYTSLFEQHGHDPKVWEDYMTGAPVNWKFNDVEYPIEVTNAGAIQDRWALVFTTKTDFNIIGEHSGIIGTGSTVANVAPIRKDNGEPYFKINKDAWGLGQEPGNVLRFNTIAATGDVWLVRSIVPSDETTKTDWFNFRFRGFISANNK